MNVNKIIDWDHHGFEPIDKHKQAILWTALERYWALPPNSLWSLEKGINRENRSKNIRSVEINDMFVSVRISGGFGYMVDWHDFMTGWQFQWLAYSLGIPEMAVPVPYGPRDIDLDEVQIWSEDNGDTVLIFSIDTWTGWTSMWRLLKRGGTYNLVETLGGGVVSCYPPLIHGFGGE